MTAERRGTKDPEVIELMEHAEALIEETKSLRTQLSALKNQVATLEQYKRRHNALEEELNRITKAVDAANEAISITDISGLQTYQNEAFTELFGYDMQALNSAGGPQALYAHPEVGALVHETIIAGNPWYGEVEMLSGSGRTISVSLKATSVKDEDGNLLGLIGVYADHTELKAAEEKLQKTVEELARSNAELQQFTYVASHDLQEPLRMVASYVQLLEKRYKNELDEDAHDFITFAVNGVAKMKSLINDLLLYSRIGMEETQREKTQIAEVLEGAVSTLRVAIEESGATITHGSLPELRVDARQMGQLLQNLIGNAIKFRGERYPEIMVEAKQCGTDWIFSVADNGIGISPEYQDRIFLIFQRLHTGMEYPGNGIGLSICRSVVEKHGGRLWFESEPGTGTTFFFSIPTDEVST